MKHEETVEVGSLEARKKSTAYKTSTFKEVQLLVDEYVG
jgi:hypothetical protein